MSTSRVPHLLIAGATAVVIGSGFTFAGLQRHAGDTQATNSAQLAPAPPALPEDDPSSAAPPPTTAPTTAPTTSPASKPPAAEPRPVVPPKKPSPKAKATSSKPKRKAPTVNVPPTGDAVLDAVLAHINAARADEGRGALTLDATLSKASELHNEAMLSNGCGLSHRCSGEADLGPRFNNQSVQFRTAGENIGFRSSGASRSAIIEAANRITDSMLAETPPNDGHRKNLLNGDFKRIGLAVTRDDGLVWFTQDFVG
ncbi:CAP domain-containing protein [Actinoplanes sp. NPDC051470]|uniref:CAP domain-containing protein n=1 Tax=Actinoplanes sp. NPDC051470 TaxID=3157224 RepID=UPI0034135060